MTSFPASFRLSVCELENITRKILFLPLRAAVLYPSSSLRLAMCEINITVFATRK